MIPFTTLIQRAVRTSLPSNWATRWSVCSICGARPQGKRRYLGTHLRDPEIQHNPPAFPLPEGGAALDLALSNVDHEAVERHRHDNVPQSHDTRNMAHLPRAVAMTAAAPAGSYRRMRAKSAASALPSNGRTRSTASGEPPKASMNSSQTASRMRASFEP